MAVRKGLFRTLSAPQGRKKPVGRGGEGRPEGPKTSRFFLKDAAAGARILMKYFDKNHCVVASDRAEQQPVLIRVSGLLCLGLQALSVYGSFPEEAFVSSVKRLPYRSCCERLRIIDEKYKKNNQKQSLLPGFCYICSGVITLCHADFY